MADKDEGWKPVGQGPVAGPGLSQGEWIPAGGQDTLILPPGASEQQQASGTTLDALRSGANTASFGNYDRAAAVARTLGDEDYATALADENRKSAEARKRSPIASTVADVGVGLGSGLGLARMGATAVPYLTSRFGGLAGVGGGIVEAGMFGAAEGAGHSYGTPQQKLEAAGSGAWHAAPFGVLGSIGGLAGEGAYRGLASQRVPGGAYIPPRLAEAGRTDATGLNEILTGTRGERVMLPDVGPNLRGTAKGAVLNPVGPGQVRLLNTLEQRTQSSDPYIDATINRLYGPAEVPSHIIRDQIQPRIDALSPHYDRILNGPQARAVDTRPIANWLEDTAINSRGERQAAAMRVRNMLDIHGNAGNLDPNPATLHAVRSAIKNELRNERGTLTSAERSLLEEADRRMTTELQAKVPGIQQIDSVRAELGAQERALRPDSPGSRMFVTERESVVRPEEFRDIMNEAAVPKGTMQFTDEPLRLRQAARAELDRIVGTNRHDLAALERVLATPRDYNQQKLAIMFGQDRADQIANVLRNERVGRETDTVVRLGSETAAREAAMKAMDAQSGRLPLETTLTGLAARGVNWAKDQIFRAQAAAQRDRIANYMAANNPAEVRAAAQQLLTVQPARDARSRVVRTMMQGGGRGASAGFIPKEDYP